MDRIMADGRSWATILKPLLESPAMRNLARDMQPTLTSYILALIKHPDIANACPERAARHYGLPVAWTREYLRREIERRRRSEEHTSELQSLMRRSYAVFCLSKKNKSQTNTQTDK